MPIEEERRSPERTPTVLAERRIGVDVTGRQAWSIVRTSGGDDLVPLWTCGTVTVFSADDGWFLQWDAEEDEPWTDFAAATRDLLTDLWEDEDRAAIAHLLLPEGDVANALVPEER